MEQEQVEEDSGNTSCFREEKNALRPVIFFLDSKLYGKNFSIDFFCAFFSRPIHLCGEMVRA